MELLIPGIEKADVYACDHFLLLFFRITINVWWQRKSFITKPFITDLNKAVNIIIYRNSEEKEQFKIEEIKEKRKELINSLKNQS